MFPGEAFFRSYGLVDGFVYHSLRKAWLALSPRFSRDSPARMNLDSFGAILPDGFVMLSAAKHPYCFAGVRVPTIKNQLDLSWSSLPK
jgi:hypothetical protein